MFTGIVQGTGKVLKIIEQTTISTFTIQLPDTEKLQIGASVSINGVCLTVVSVNGDIVVFDVITETLERTNLGDLAEGELVNIERSLRYGDEVGGHLLSGHIFGTGIVQERLDSGEDVVFKILAPPNVVKYLSEKGYIAIDGISLTLGLIDNGVFNLHIIPETMRITTLDSRQVGDVVNIEIDNNTQVIVDTVERILSKRD